jgi:DNA-binding SARP family transcriptional activator
MTVEPDNLDESISRSESADSASQATLHGTYFEVDQNMNVTRWPREAVEHTRIPAEKALGQPCWKVVHPDRETPPFVCEHYCLAKANRRPPVDPPEKIDFEYCATISLPEPQKGALVWIPSRKNTPRVRHDPMEDLLVRGCLSANIDNVSHALDFVRKYCAADDSEIYLLDPSRDEVFYCGCEGLDKPAFSSLTRIPLGAGYPGRVTARQEPMYTNDFQNERIFLRESVRRCGIRSFLGIPLSEDGHSVGYLGIGWRDPAVPLEPLIPRLNSILPLFHFGLLKQRSELLKRPDPETSVSIHCFGEFQLRRGGVPLSHSAFKRRKALQLLKLLILHAPHPVHRDVLIESLWPGADATTGGNRLHGVVHALRAAIEPHWEQRRFTFIRQQQDFYFLDLSADHFIDLLVFRRMLNMGRAAKKRHESPEQIASYFESAISIYRGDLFADDIYADAWIQNSRTQLRHEYLDAVRELVDQYARVGRFEDILSRLSEAMAFEPYAEDLHHSLIRTLLRLGRRAEANERFSAYVRALRHELNVDPLPETLALSKLLG